MLDLSFLNPQLLPSSPIPKDEHRRTITGLVIAVVILALIALGYWWWSASQQPAQTPIVDQQAQARAEAVAILRNAQPASQKDIQAAVTKLSKATPATKANIQNAVMQLKQSTSQEF